MATKIPELFTKGLIFIKAWNLKLKKRLGKHNLP